MSSWKVRSAAPAAWDDARVVLPDGFSGNLIDQLTGKPVATASGAIAIAEALAELPVALLFASG